MGCTWIVRGEKIVTTINNSLKEEKKDQLNIKYKEDHEKGKLRKIILQEIVAKYQMKKQMNRGK